MARLLSGETAMYSGSKSSDGARSTPGETSKIRTPASFRTCAWASKAAKPTVVTGGAVKPEATLMMETEPGAVSTPSACISPSSAVNTLLPSGVKVIMSGRTPTVTDPMRSPVAAVRKTT